MTSILYVLFAMLLWINSRAFLHTRDKKGGALVNVIGGALLAVLIVVMAAFTRQNHLMVLLVLFLEIAMAFIVFGISSVGSLDHASASWLFFIVSIHSVLAGFSSFVTEPQYQLLWLAWGLISFMLFKFLSQKHEDHMFMKILGYLLSILSVTILWIISRVIFDVPFL